MKKAAPRPLVRDERRRVRQSISRLSLFLACLFVVTLHAEAQTLHGSGFASGLTSPTAASLGKFGDIPVNLSTGVPNITIPLHDAEGITLSLPISMRYHSGGGIKVEEIASWVGLGWALDAGGVITRVVRGLPDEVSSGYMGCCGYQMYDNSYVTNLLNGCGSAGPDEVANEWKDSEPDEFFFNFAGRAGRFTVGKNPDGSTFIKSIPYGNIKFEPTVQSITNWGPQRDRFISSWVATTEDGTQFVFDEIEVTNVDDESGGLLRKHVSAWYLTRIKSAVGNDEILLHYSQPYAVSQTMRARRELVSEPGVECPEINSDRTTRLVNQITTVRLEKIETAKETILFVKSNNKRADFTPSRNSNTPQDYSLARIEVHKKSFGGLEHSFSWQLHHSYFGEGNPHHHLRLRLDSLKQVGYDGTSVPPYKFKYNGNLPSRYSYAYDWWGYYNGKTANGEDGGGGPAHRPLPSMVIPYQDLYPGDPTQWTLTIDGVDKSPTSAAAAALLREIQYPTGGIAKFIYEANTYGYIIADATQNLSNPVGGVRIARIEKSEHWQYGNHVTTSYTYTMENASLFRPFPGNDPQRSSGVIRREPNAAYHHSGGPGSCDYVAVSDRSRGGLGGGAPVYYQKVDVHTNDLTGPDYYTAYGRETHFFSTINGFLGGIEVFDGYLDGPDPEVKECGVQSDYYLWHDGIQTDYSWLLGLPLMSLYFDNDTQLVKKEEVRYSLETQPHQNPLVSTPAFQVKSFLRHDGTLNHRAFGYHVISGFIERSAMTTYHCVNPIKNPTSCYDWQMVHDIRTEFSTDEWPRPIRITSGLPGLGGGPTRVEEIEYASDIWEYSPMLNEHMLAQVYSRSVKQGSSLESKDWTEYYTSGNNVGRVSRTWKWKGGATGSPDSSNAIQTAHIEASDYDSFGRPLVVKDAHGNSTSFTYGHTNDAYLVRIDRPSGVYNRYEYDSRGNLTRLIDANERAQQFTYDDLGRLESIRRNVFTAMKTGFEYEYGNPSFVRRTDYTTSNSAATAYVTTEYVDGFGNTFQVHQQDGDSTIVSKTEINGLGHVWRSWKPYRRYNPSGDFNFGYDECQAAAYYSLQCWVGRPYVEHRYSEDPTGRVSAVLSEATSSVADSVYYSHDVETIGGKRLVRVTSTDEAGVVSRSYTDALGRQVRTVADVGGIEATTIFEYDVLDRHTAVTDPEGQSTSYLYNEAGHLVQKTTPDAGTVKYIYDDMGNLRFSQDAKQAAGWTKYALFYTYDDDNRPLIYGQIAVSDFDNLNPYEFSLPDQSAWISRNAYDAKPNTGEFPWSLFASEINNTFLGNLGGRLAANAYKSGALWQLTLYAYDNDGRLLNKYIFSTNWSGVNSALNTRLHYQRNRQSQVTRLWRRVGSQNWYQWYDYDGAGRLAEVRSGTSSLESSSVLDAVYTYRPSGAIASRQFQGGPVVTYTYTIREWLRRIGGNPESLFWSNPQNVPFAADYVYTPSGNVDRAVFYNKQLSNQLMRYDFQYDNLSRLTDANFVEWMYPDWWTGSNKYNVSDLTYDKNGNIKKLQRRRENGSLVDNLTYNYHSTLKNRLVSVSDASGAPTSWDTGTLSFSYDANGNVRFFDDLSRGIYRDVIYDHRNLPLTIETLDYSDGASYRYTADGQRYFRGRYYQTAEHYVLDDATTVGVFTETGTRRHWNIVANGQVIGRFEGTTRKYYHTDMLGSTRAVTNASNTVLEAIDYYPLGHIMPGRSYLSGTATRERFTGKERGGEGGWDYYGARYYVPAIGRWLVTDPLAEAYASWSPYNYVLNNPTRLIDPDGNCVAFGGFIDERSGECFGGSVTGTCRPGVDCPQDDDHKPDTDNNDDKDEWIKRAIEDPMVMGVPDWFVVGTAPLQITTRVWSWLRGTGGRMPVLFGKSGEKAVRAVYDIGSKKSIEVGGRIRVPDGITQTTISEIKNVRTLSYTRQLRDYVRYAKDNRLSFDLYVRPSTRLSQPLLDAVRHGHINLKFIPGTL